MAVLLMIVAVVLFFFLPFFDNKPTETKGKIITLSAYFFILFAVIMTIWSLL
jgi:quinol-cytochrome oxidoreductase complex cytochrome b subunit